MDSVLQPVQDKLDAQAAQIFELETELSLLTNQTVFSELQSIPVYPKDTKTPFQWIQPGNTGNTGGGSSLPHGTFTWSPSRVGETRITVHPVNIDGKKSDDFFFYCILPYRGTPTKFTWECDNYSAASSQSWQNSQQFEFQNELIADGFQNIFAWRIHPSKGLGYYDKNSVDKWNDFKPQGSNILIDLSKPTAFKSVCSIDRANHTVILETIKVNNQEYEAGITINATSQTGTQFSTAVQLDGKPTGVSYDAILDGLKVSYA